MILRPERISLAVCSATGRVLGTTDIPFTARHPYVCGLGMPIMPASEKDVEEVLQHAILCGDATVDARTAVRTCPTQENIDAAMADGSLTPGTNMALLASWVCVYRIGFIPGGGESGEPIAVVLVHPTQFYQGVPTFRAATDAEPNFVDLTYLETV